MIIVNFIIMDSGKGVEIHMNNIKVHEVETEEQALEFVKSIFNSMGPEEE